MQDGQTVPVEAETQEAKSPWAGLLKVAGLIGALIGFAFGKVAGLNLLIPLGLGWAANLALKRWALSLSEKLRLLLAAQFAHIGWMSLAVLVPGGITAVLPDLMLMAALFAWVWHKPGSASLIALTLFEGVTLTINVYNLYLIGEASTSAIPAVVHIMLRLLIIYFAVQVYRERRGNPIEGHRNSVV